MSLRPERIILHCSDTEDGDDLSWPAIRRYHVETRGWSDIGYHFGIEKVRGPTGLERTLLLPGRPPTVIGAHCRAGGRNRDSLGVCVVGKFDEVAPSPFLKADVFDGLALIAFAHGIEPDRIHFHRDFEPAKTCPGRLWNLDEVRAGVERRLRPNSPAGRHLRLDLVGLP